MFNKREGTVVSVQMTQDTIVPKGIGSHSHNSSQYGFIENCMGYLLKKDADKPLKFERKYPQNTERLIYSAAPVIYILLNLEL